MRAERARACACCPRSIGHTAESGVEVIEDKDTEKWKGRAKKLGLIVNMGVDKSKPKAKASETDGKVNVKPGGKEKK